MYGILFCFCLVINLFVCFSQDHMQLRLYAFPQQNKRASSINLKFDRFFPSKIDNKKAFLSSSFAMLCAPNKASLVTPSAASRGSSAGLLRERSISMWLSLIHWARKNCLANYERKQNQLRKLRGNKSLDNEGDQSRTGCDKVFGYKDEQDLDLRSR